MQDLEAWFAGNWIHIVYIIGFIIALAVLSSVLLGLGCLHQVALQRFRTKRLAALEKKSEVLAELQAQRGGEIENGRQRIRQLETELVGLKQTAIIREKALVSLEENLAGRATAIATLRKELDAAAVAHRAETEKAQRVTGELQKIAQASATALERERAEVEQISQENTNLLTANAMLQRQYEAAEKQGAMLSATLTDTNHQRDLLQLEVKNLREQNLMLKGNPNA